jgi:hypothetical protein
MLAKSLTVRSLRLRDVYEPLLSGVRYNPKRARAIAKPGMQITGSIIFHTRLLLRKTVANGFLIMGVKAAAAQSLILEGPDSVRSSGCWLTALSSRSTTAAISPSQTNDAMMRLQ